MHSFKKTCLIIVSIVFFKHEDQFDIFPFTAVPCCKSFKLAAPVRPRLDPSCGSPSVPSLTRSVSWSASGSEVSGEQSPAAADVGGPKEDQDGGSQRAVSFSHPQPRACM